MDITMTLIANTQASDPMEPTEGGFDYPTPRSKALVRFDAAPGNPHGDTAVAQPDSMAPVVVAFVTMQFRRALAGPTRGPAYRWQCSDQCVFRSSCIGN